MPEDSVVILATILCGKPDSKTRSHSRGKVGPPWSKDPNRDPAGVGFFALDLYFLSRGLSMTLAGVALSFC